MVEQTKKTGDAMAMEFPSRVAAAGFVEGTGVPFNSNARGCVVTQTGPGDYLITLDRNMSVGWAAISVTPTIGAPVNVAQIAQNAFQVATGQADFDFFFVIHAIDESQ